MTEGTDPWAELVKHAEEFAQRFCDVVERVRQEKPAFDALFVEKPDEPELPAIIEEMAKAIYGTTYENYSDWAWDAPGDRAAKELCIIEARAALRVVVLRLISSGMNRFGSQGDGLQDLLVLTGKQWNELMQDLTVRRKAARADGRVDPK